MSDISPLRTAVTHGSGLKRMNGVWGEVLAEFLGTFVLVAFGNGVVAMTVVGLPGSGRTAGPTEFFMGAGDWLLIALGWFLAVTFGVYVAGGVSGAHLNPAVTLAFAVRRRFAWRKVIPYWIAQIVGAFVAAALVYLLYFNAIDAFNAAAGTARPDSVATYSIFATFPAPYFNGNMLIPFLDQVVGTMFLLMLIAAVIDGRNMAVKANLGPFIIGLVVAAIGMSFGANAGYAINPARDFGPRLFAWLAGWGEVAMPGTVAGAGGFTAYFWVPIVGPLVGGVIGIVLYDLFIGDVLHARGAGVAETAETGPAEEQF